MISRNAKRARKKRRMLVEAAIPPDLQDLTCPELRVIITDYFKILLTLPVARYGELESAERFQFAFERSERLTADGPVALANPMVGRLFEFAMENQRVRIDFGTNGMTVLTDMIAEGVRSGLFALLELLEDELREIPDSALAELSLGEAEAETFRSLARQFSGTFDELIEVSRTL